MPAIAQTTHRLTLAALGWLATALPAQHAKPAAETTPAPAAPTTAEQKRGSQTPPTHAPHLQLTPQDAFAFVRASHLAWRTATEQKQPPPPPAERPSGAGRYVCAVIACADLDRDPATLLGMRREDILLITTPGPFVTPEITATITRQVREEKLSLVLVLTHSACSTLQKQAPTSRRDVLTARVEVAERDAQRRRLPITKALAQAQRELLIASAEELAAHTDDNTLRVVPGEIDSKTGAITWYNKAVDEMPMPPVK